ncbi:MAG: hydrolase [Firmicutes bacterium]|nr:hydrolase [Bacillota bacterium]
MLHAEIARLKRRQAVLAVIDIQEKLLPHMWEPQKLVANSVRLVSAASVLGIPVLVSEQYPKGLGTMPPELSAVLPPDAFRLEKLEFSAQAVDAFAAELARKGRRQVILCGMEAHVCIIQTVLDLLAAGYHTFIAADAVSAHTTLDRDLAFERARGAGAILSTTDSIILELVGKAGTPEFKATAPLIKY